jgi:hypothetical protein
MTQLAKRIQHARIITTVDQRIHNDKSFYTEGPMHSERLIHARGLGCVGTPRLKWKTLRITEDMGMAIAGAVGSFEADAGGRLRRSARRRPRFSAA